LRRNLITIQVLLFLLPAVVLTYVLYSSRAVLGPAHLVVFASTLMLVLAGLVTVRQVFDRFTALAALMSDASRTVTQVHDFQVDTAELQEITESFNGLVARLEDLGGLLDRKVVELSAIRGLIEFSSKSLSIDHLLGLLLEEAMSVSGAQVGSVLVLEKQQDAFRVVAARGHEPALTKNALIPVAQCLSGLLMTDPNPLIIQDIQDDPRTSRPNNPQYSSPSFMTLPLTVRGELVATLNLAARADGEMFTPADREVVALMISQVSLALESSRLYSEVQEHLHALERRTHELGDANRLLRQEVDDRRQVQEALNTSNALLRNILDSSTSISIISTDLDGTIQFWNRGAANLFGYRPEDVVGREKIGILYPDGETREQVEGLRSAVLRDKRTATAVIREQAKDGRVLWVHLSVSPRLNESGAVVGVLGIGEDVTERRELEEQLSHAQKLEAVGTLAGGVAHDFNNILMAIQGHTSLMLFGLDPQDRNYPRLKTIEEHVRRAADLTQQLLGFARGGRYAPQPTDLREIVSRTLDIFSRTHKTIEVVAELHPDTPTVEVDRGQLEQVLLNLYLNAAQAMPDGGRLAIRSELGHLDGPYARSLGLAPGRYLRLSVTDTGEGIDPQIQKKIFEPFFTTKRPGKGSGLGLASAYGIVRKHRGVITVYSEPGHGATFVIMLPASDAPPETEANGTAAPIPGTGLVLVVDDEEAIREVARAMVASLGYETMVAASGVEAVALCAAHTGRISAVVLDLIMPGMSGGETFDRLRAIDPDVRVLLSSGYSLDGLASDILKRGCRAFIQKPFGLSELSEKLHLTISGSQ
jgi:PAS domain S-box-containing protein